MAHFTNRGSLSQNVPEKPYRTNSVLRAKREAYLKLYTAISKQVYDVNLKSRGLETLPEYS